ncbi:MAG: YceD family protein [Jaaginema sp. PMC 1079.18]|nr:YceD family protein [Jaaginema sp. PMC 1080.18]MEC4853667.1 YceD family protein [Jaaginema sp. PMC 1079.18]MEC4869012.1 YceD family protein [Jaaginema sp. PMC 1078.18]
MKPLHIPSLLNAPAQTVELEIQQNIAELETLTPVRGKIIVTHCKTYLEVSVQAETITTLTCHRCLRHYNQRLSLNTQELIWLEDEAEFDEDLPLERELQLEDFSEKLPPRGYFDPETWLYEQLSLALPLQQMCQADDCQSMIPDDTSSHVAVDSRWAGLEALKRQLS